MSQAGSFRICPKCNSHRVLDELVCQGLVDETPCEWSLVGEPIHHADEHLDGNPSSQHPPIASGRVCLQGHEVAQDDLICPVCSSDLVVPDIRIEGSTEPEGANSQPEISDATREGPIVIGGWQVVRQMPTVGDSRECFIVQRIDDQQRGILTRYAPGMEPQPDVYETSRRLPAAHIPELIETGHWKGQVFEVVDAMMERSLADWNFPQGNPEILRCIVEEIAVALDSFSSIGLTHREIRPDTILVRTSNPLDLVVTGFGSARLSHLDLETEASLQSNRYMAPEAIMGAVTAASDWWSLGMIVLDKATSGGCFEGANDQLFMIHVIANGVPIPSGLDPRFEILLRGLLANDRTQRWKSDQVRAWLNGETPEVPSIIPRSNENTVGRGFRLAGQEFRSPARFAEAAARAANWDEALALLELGAIAATAEEMHLDARQIASLQRLSSRTDFSPDFRLSLALKVLHPALPLIIRETIIRPEWLTANPELGFELIMSPVPEILNQFEKGSEEWLVRIADRAKSVLERAKSLHIELNSDEFHLLVLSSSRTRNLQMWTQQRAEFPDSNQPGLSSIMERSDPSDEDLIILLSAELSQFRHMDEVLVAARDTGSPLAITLQDTIAREFLAKPKAELYDELDRQLDGFAKCGISQLDEWADEFRISRRLPLENILLLLALPVAQWEKPSYQDYMSRLIEFFEKKAAGSILRGALVRMSIGKTTPRVDLTELATDHQAATELVSGLLLRRDRRFKIKPEVLAVENGPERRLRSLLMLTEKYERDTGINGLYLGFPFLLRQEGSGKSPIRVAPVLLWPVKLHAEVGHRGNCWLSFDNDRQEVRLNPAFDGLLGINIASKWRAVASMLLSRAALTPLDVLHEFLEADLARVPDPTLRQLRDQNLNVGYLEDELRNSAVLFHMDYAGQAIVEDLRKIRGQAVGNSALERVLRVRTEQQPQTQNVGNNQQTEDPTYLIATSDPSQESAILNARIEPGIVIQGPPGTGKSQTIVNLIADAVGRRKTVLVICQKLPALKVVHKRLAAEGLEGLLAMVTDINGDRQGIIRSIRDQLQARTRADLNLVLAVEAETKRLQNQIQGLEDELDQIYGFHTQTDPQTGMTYREILDELMSVEEESGFEVVDVPGLRTVLQDLEPSDLKQIQESCSSLAGDWLPSYFESSPLSALNLSSENDATIEELLRVFDAFAVAEAERERLLLETPPGIETNDPETLERWLESHEATLLSMDVATRIAIAPFIPLFKTAAYGPLLVETIECLIKLQENWVAGFPAITDLGTHFSGQNSAVIEQTASQCSILANEWFQARFEGSPLHAVLPFARTDLTLREFQNLLQTLVNAETEREAAIELAATILSQELPGAFGVSLEVNGTSVLSEFEEKKLHATLTAWLEKHSPLFLETPSEICSCITAWFDLFTPRRSLGTKGDEIIARIHRARSQIEGLNLDAYEPSLIEIASRFSPEELSQWLGVSKKGFRKKRSMFWWMNPSRIFARRRISEFLENAQLPATGVHVDEFIKTMFLEQRLRNIWTDWRPIAERLKLSISYEQALTAFNLRDIILSTAEDVMAVVEVISALRTCPLKVAVVAADRLAEPNSYASVIRRLQVVHQWYETMGRSRKSVESLRFRMSQAWIDKCLVSIHAGTSASDTITPVIQSLPHLEQFLSFRDNLVQLPHLACQTFAFLAEVRPHLESLQPALRCEFVRRLVLFHAYKDRKYQIIAFDRTLSKFESDALPTLMEAIDILRSAQRLESIARDCPDKKFEHVLGVSGSSLLRSFGMLHGAVARGRAREASIHALKTLSPWMSPEWMRDVEESISTNSSVNAKVPLMRLSLPRLHAYLTYRTIAEGLTPLQSEVFSLLAPHRVAIEALSEVDAGQAVRQIMRREILLTWLYRIESQNRLLLPSRRVSEDKIAKLRTLDRNLREKNRSLLQMKYLTRAVSSWQDWQPITGLRGERSVSLRDFFVRARPLGLLSLRPVWMMIPSAASQLLPLERAMFDLVIYDEASQMPVEYALPTLYRSKLVVVSGDEKQMPPASFFSSTFESDEEDDDVSELSEDAAEEERALQEQAWDRKNIKDCPDLLHLAESILPRSTLLVHYRSVFRELIAFSNAAYYRNELSVPRIHSEEDILSKRPIEYHDIQGVYAKQTNVDEAKFIVNYLAEFWRNNGSVRPSIGIVTFNQKQAQLIDELIELHAQDDAEFRTRYAEERQRRDNGEDISIFVKNVENVQGDERDVIIFSTTFGKTSNGVFRRVFGVLGHGGGEYRLNVAVTRARKKVVVVTSMPIDKISNFLQQDGNLKGPRDYLQAYSEYARLVSSGQLAAAKSLTGRFSEHVQQTASPSLSKNAFHRSVERFLLSLGYTPVRLDNDPVLGVDFALVRQGTGEFFLGIQCDVPEHRLLVHARGRELWRPELLRQTFLNLVQVSPRDWCRNRKHEQQRLAEAIQQALGG